MILSFGIMLYLCVPSVRYIVEDFRLDDKYEMEYDYDFSNLGSIFKFIT